MKNRECRKFYVLPLLVLLSITALLMGACTTPEKAKAQHVARGQALLKDRKFQEAVLEFRNALQIDDQLADAHWGLANAFEGLQRYQEAFEEMKEVIDLDPNNLDVRVKLGNYYLVGSNQSPAAIGEAERLAKEVLQKDANHIEGHILLGRVLFAQDHKDQASAERTFQRPIPVSTASALAHYEYAKFLVQTGRSDAAETEFLKAVEVEPVN